MTNLYTLLPFSAIGAYAFSKFFSRDPHRNIPPGDDIVSPSDGKVYDISDNIVKIVIGIQDVHIIRAPISGTIESITSVPGDTIACISTCPRTNRHKRITISTDAGDIDVLLIHGKITKNIELLVSPGQSVEKGARLGRIVLGSGSQVTIPSSYEIAVSPGSRVFAGSSIIATNM
jgi:phosphatidylserine decarboxylase